MTYDLVVAFLEAFVDRLHQTGALSVPPEDLTTVVEEAAADAAE